MNAKLLFAATVAVSALATLASTTVLASETPTSLSRADLVAQYEQARAAGTLQRTDYDAYDSHADRASGKAASRADVIAAMASRPSPLLTNGSARSRTYNPFGAELLQASTMTRAEVKAETLQAAANGTLQRTDYEHDRAVVARGVVDPTTKPTLARLFRRTASGS